MSIRRFRQAKFTHRMTLRIFLLTCLFIVATNKNILLNIWHHYIKPKQETMNCFVVRTLLHTNAIWATSWENLSSGVFHQVRHKSASSATEVESWNLEYGNCRCFFFLGNKQQGANNKGADQTARMSLLFTYGRFSGCGSYSSGINGFSSL